MVRFPPGNLTVPNRLLRVLLIPALMALAACASGSQAADPPSATLAPATTVTTDPQEADEPELTVEEEVEAAYLEAELVFLSFMENPNQPLELLDATRTGESLEGLIEHIDERRENRLVAHYPTGYPVSTILEVDVEGDSARVTACIHDDAVLRDADGEVANDRVTTLWVIVGLERIDQAWLVSSQSVDRSGKGRQPCR